MMQGPLRDIRRHASRKASRVLAGAVLAFALAAAALAEQLPELTLSLSGQRLAVEVAGTEAARMQGLMHRRMLPESRGMLFVFREPALHGMWMVNTYVPLSVAFLDERGVIINTASVLGFEGDENLIDYSATKGALRTFTKSLASALGKRKIRVNAVAPSPVWTPLNPSERDHSERHHIGWKLAALQRLC